jgi:hypothetical protein
MSKKDIALACGGFLESNAAQGHGVFLGLDASKSNDLAGEYPLDLLTFRCFSDS